MEKYNFGEEIIDGSTMEWTNRHIDKKSKVLELGPAVGTLTKYLKEEKMCSVDIVEIDEESGKKAAQYADIACIGKHEGNLEENIWFDKLIERKYDYIIILDVLEHLRCPAEVLKKTKILLNENGIMLLSIPNIAHNSVIINLIRNKFDYTPLGLLDNTHVHFFSYESACEMLEGNGLTIIEKDAVQLRVGDIEIKNEYTDIGEEVEKILRLREMADVYQFLFAATKKANAESAFFQPTNLDYTLYKLEIYNNQTLLKNFFVNPRKIDIELDVTNFPNQELRIDPLEKNCILNNIQINAVTSAGECIPLKISKTNGIEYMEGSLLFLDNDSQIYIYICENITKIAFAASAIAFDEKWICEIEKVWRDKLKWESYAGELVLERDTILQQNQTSSLKLLKEIDEQKFIIKERYEEIKEKNQEIKRKNSELEIKSEELKEKNQEITEKKQEITEKKQEIAEKNQEIAEKKQEIAEKKQEITEKNQEIAEKKQEITEKKQEITEKKQEITEKKQEITEKNQEITEKKQEIAEKNQEITEKNQEILEKTAELEEIKSLKFYKIRTKCRQMKNNLMRKKEN